MLSRIHRICLAFGLGAILPAQGPAAVSDPYTDGKPARCEKLGVLSFGPFPLGDEHGSAAVDALVGAGKVAWLETAHFHIGCALPTLPMPEVSRFRKAIQEECRQLHKLVGAFPEAPSSLDPWLHAHLFAARLEALYAAMQARVGVDDAWFAANAQAAGRGSGPRFGCRGKFAVLLFAQEAELGRYLRRYCDDTSDRPRVTWFQATDAQVFATSVDARGGRLRDPALLHAHVVHAVAGMLVSAYVGVPDVVPWWFENGIGHWYARLAHERSVDIGDLAEDEFALDETWEWESRIGQRVRKELVPPWRTVLTWTDGSACRPMDHAMHWSMVDFLFVQGEVETIRWFRHLRAQPPRTRLAPPALIERWHEAALQAALGCGLTAAEGRWRKFASPRGR